MNFNPTVSDHTSTMSRVSGSPIVLISFAAVIFLLPALTAVDGDQNGSIPLPDIQEFKSTLGTIDGSSSWMDGNVVGDDSVEGNELDEADQEIDLEFQEFLRSLKKPGKLEEAGRVFKAS